MKKIKYLIILAVFTVLTGCCDDDNDEAIQELSIELLKQTGWNGTIIDNNAKKVTETCTVGLLFKSDNVGTYTMKVKSFNEETTGNFTYRIDHKRLTITKVTGNNNGGSYYLQGDWMLLRMNNTVLELQKNLDGEGFDEVVSTMSLNKTYK